MMKLSAEGKKLLEELEGKKYRLYYCKGGKPTIGIGCVVNPNQYYDVRLTDKQVYELLDRTLEQYEKIINESVKVPLLQNQYDALVCFIFNIGINGFLKSTALKRLNEGDYPGCIAAMKWWKWVTHEDGVRHPDLVSRRAKEEVMWNATKTEPM